MRPRGDVSSFVRKNKAPFSRKNGARKIVKPVCQFCKKETPITRIAGWSVERKTLKWTCPECRKKKNIS